MVGFMLIKILNFYRSMNDMIKGPNSENGNCRKNILVRSSHYLKLVSNFVMASEPKSEFFWFVINELNKGASSIWHMEETYIGTMFVAGPTFLQKCVYSYPEIDRDVTILDWWSFCTDEPKWYFGEFLKDNKQGKNDFDFKIGNHGFHTSWGVPKKLRYDIFRLLIIILIIIIIVVFIIYFFKKFGNKNFRKIKKL